MQDVEASPYEPVPLHLRNAVTKLMKDLSYGEGYEYAHDAAFETTDMETFPDRFKGRVYYVPGSLGKELDIRKRIDWWESLKARIRSEKTGGNKGRRKEGESA
jgi:putative ATPase